MRHSAAHTRRWNGVPCHRVVNRGGGLGGYAGGLAIKQQLLALEGAR